MKIKMLTKGYDEEFNRNVWEKDDVYDLSNEQISDEYYIIKTINDETYGVSKKCINRDFIILEE